MRYWKESSADKNEVYFSPNQLDEKVATLHSLHSGMRSPSLLRDTQFLKGVKPRSPTKIKHICVLSCTLWYATECAQYDCGPNR